MNKSILFNLELEWMRWSSALLTLGISDKVMKLWKLTVEDYDPSVASTWLSVVSKTHMVTLCARSITVTMIIKVVATETSIAWFHPGELKEKKIHKWSGTHNFLEPGQSKGADNQKSKPNTIYIIDSFPRKQMHMITSRTNIDSFLCIYLFFAESFH